MDTATKKNACYVTFSSSVSDIAYTTPVIVFVHGWNKKRSGVWSKLRSMIDHREYRCAFMNLNYRGSIRENSAELMRQLTTVTERYNVSNVVIVAHSKGGLDVQGAILYHHAERYIDCVVTLATPHWGSPLPDLMLPLIRNVSSRCANAIMCDAVADMRVAEMAAFRKEFDCNQRCTDVVFMTLNGTGTDNKCSSPGGSIKKTILNMYGPNDDMVVLSMSLKPGAYDLGTLPVDHERMNSSPAVWAIIQTCITDRQIPVTVTPATYDGTPDTFVNTVTAHISRTVTNSPVVLFLLALLLFVIVRRFLHSTSSSIIIVPIRSTSE